MRCSDDKSQRDLKMDQVFCKKRPKTGCILIFQPGFQGFQGRVLGFLGLFQGFSTRILANVRVLPQPIISAFLNTILHFHVSRPPNPLSSSFLVLCRQQNIIFSNESEILGVTFFLELNNGHFQGFT